MSTTRIAIGAGLGFLGYHLYQSYKAGAMSVPNPGAYIYLIKTDPIGTLAPLALGYFAYVYAPVSGTYMRYGAGLLGGAVGTMIGPMLKTGA